MSRNPATPTSTAGSPPRGRLGVAFYATVLLIVATAGQLAVATFVSGLPQFEGKAFGSRLLFYPLMMTAPIAVWWLATRRRAGIESLPWAGFACVSAPFFIDVTGNTLDLYDQIVWWDDANHFFNWLLLCLGIGLMLERSGLQQRWALAVIVTGIGAILAVAWELAEWYLFIRHGTELATAYTDTLGDEALGTLGALVAGLIVAFSRRRRGARAPR